MATVRLHIVIYNRSKCLCRDGRLLLVCPSLVDGRPQGQLKSGKAESLRRTNYLFIIAVCRIIRHNFLYHYEVGAPASLFAISIHKIAEHVVQQPWHITVAYDQQATALHTDESK